MLPPSARRASATALAIAYDGDPDAGKGRCDRRVRLVHGDPHPQDLWEPIEDGLRDRAGYAAGAATRRIPLDDKLFAIKGPTSLTISTVNGRVLVPFEVPGYLAGWESPFPAHLVSDGPIYEIHIAVKSKSTQPEEKTMLHEGILARMGRLLAAIASQTIDNAESGNKVALVKQAIREIDAGAAFGGSTNKPE